MGRICQRAQRAAAGVRVLSALTASACMAVMTAAGARHARTVICTSRNSVGGGPGSGSVLKMEPGD